MPDDGELTIGPYVTGEKPAPLQYQFLDSSGVPMDLTGYTAKLSVQERFGSPTEYSAVMAVAASGVVSYAWTGTEWPTPGRYAIQFWVGNGTNRYASVRMVFAVASSVGPVPII
jgi:hypothetical protein